MTIEIAIVLLIIFGSFIAMLKNIAIDIVMFMVLLLLILSNSLTPSEALQGFGNEALFVIALLFIVAKSLVISGSLLPILQRVLSPKSTAIVNKARLMLTVSTLSAFVNNTPIVSSLIPIIQQWCRQNGFAVSHFLMPVSFASIVGGMCSLLGTSTNIVLNQLYVNEGNKSFHLFEFALAGIPIVAVTTVYMLFAARYLNAFDSAKKQQANVREFSIEMLVECDSPIDGKSIEDANLKKLNGVYLLEIVRDNKILSNVASHTIINGNDRLIFVGNIDSIVDLESIVGLTIATDHIFKLESERDNHIILEAVVSAFYPFLDRKIRDSDFSRYYGAAIIAISREGTRIKKQIGDVVLRPGDVLLLEADHKFMERHKNSPDYLVFSEFTESKPINTKKSIRTVSIVACALLLASFHIVSLLYAVVAAVILLLLFNCMTLRNLRSAIDHQVILTIATSFAMGTAFYNSGAASLLTSYLFQLGFDNIYSALIVVYIVTAVLTALITNIAAALLMFPVALHFAEALQLPLEAFIVTLAFASSASFATPIGYQTNLMVVGPGGYQFKDFLKIGIPLTFITGAMTIYLVPLIWL